MDIAKAILDNVDADDRQKALAQHAFEVAPHEHALAPMLANLNIPRDAKADLWNAKRQSMHDPKLTRLAQIAALPKNLLDIAESHPNVTKLLMTEDKEEKSSSAKNPKSDKKDGNTDKGDKKSKKEVAKSSSDTADGEISAAQSTPPVREPEVSDTPSARTSDADSVPDSDSEVNSERGPRSLDRAYYHDYHMNERGEVIHTPV